MKKKPGKKRRKLVRERDWESSHETAFTHDRARHRRALGKLAPSASGTAAIADAPEPNALVIGHSKKWAFVTLDGDEHLCRIDEHLQEGTATLVAPGDRVFVDFVDDEPWVRAIAPRTTQIARPAGQHDRRQEQVFAANVDVLVVVAAAVDPPFRPGLIDRYLVVARLGGVEPILVVSKMDLVDGLPKGAENYPELGVAVYPVSNTTGAGLDALRKALGGKTAVLAGHSGVGKSSLLNALDPDLRIHTQPVSDATSRGRHTTTAARLYSLAGDIQVIDTPGIRALGLASVAPGEVEAFFPEIAACAVACKFRNCTHTVEPSCAVREAVERGELPRLRYESYLRIRTSLESESGQTPGRLSVQHHTNADG